MTQKDNKPVLELVNSAKQPPRKIIPNKPGGNGGNSGGGNGSSKTKRFGDYIIKNGAFYQIKSVRDGADGRLLILELAGIDVDNAILTRLQRAAEAGNFTGLMSATCNGWHRA